jgi:HEAT repeat protein
MKVTARCQYLNAVAACLAVVSVGAPATRAQQQPPTAKDLSAVIEMLRSPDPVVRVSVACARDVFNSSATAAIPALIDLLNDAEPVSPEVCREDHRRWWGDEHPITPGQEAARALVRIGTTSFDPLVKALGNGGATARRNAAWALGALDDPKAVQPLIGALRDPAAMVRRQTAWALGAIDNSAAVDALVATLKDTDADVREQAAWALGAIGDARALAGLTAALKDSASGVRRQAAWALGAIQ